MSNRFKEFFMDMPEGQQYQKQLRELIDGNHVKAENDPEHARDHTQRAKGIREAIALVQSLSADDYKPGQEDKD